MALSWKGGKGVRGEGGGRRGGNKDPREKCVTKRLGRVTPTNIPVSRKNTRGDLAINNSKADLELVKYF